MKHVIKKISIPVCGVMLGTAALGNLLQSYSEKIRYVCGGFAALLLVGVLLKLILDVRAVKEELKTPVGASVAGTFSMALMIFSTYLKPFIGKGAYYLWVSAIGLHLVLICYFTVKFMIKLQMPKVFASYYIVYVGIAVAAITAPAYEKPQVGSLAFWFGFLTLLLLLVLVTYRYMAYKEVPDPAKPLICIYAAPASLCLAGYIQSVTPKSYGFLMAMFALSSVLYLFGLVKALQCLKMPFFPSYAAFTFPFVISAIAAKQTMVCAANLGHPLPVLRFVVLAETAIAVCLVVYTYIRFVGFLFGKGEK
ncbi:TDT family transporter [Clostridiaceae bacterium 68-1-5]|uniref:TDT family transporter n=1 Tax=Suipraeoptans intestinalis TaxID=2606628 RepID=A0A6N7V4S9_9FIRM|nr:TDT family transporter [Suipraeoptans intestinalis]MSR94192.1 TDT family transporter [Suipraeoptans intestinalis]